MISTTIPALLPHKQISTAIKRLKQSRKKRRGKTVKQGSNITNLMCFKEVLIKINTLQHLALVSFFYISLREEIICRRNFFGIDFAINDSKIKEFFYAIRSVLKNFAEF